MTHPILTLYDQEVRLAYTPPPYVCKQTFPHVVRWHRPASATIVYTHCDESQVDAVVQEQVAHLSSLGQPCVWVVYDHDQPANLKDRLAAHGLVPEQPEAFMVLDLQQAPSSLLAPPALDVRRVTQPEQIVEAGAIMQAVWGGNPQQRERNITLDLSIPGYMSMFLAYVDGVPASTARIHYFPGSQFAALRGGVTLPEHRGRGLYTAVLALRVQEAIQRGYRYLIIEASDMSAPIAAKHSFQFLEYVQEHRWIPHSPSLPVSGREGEWGERGSLTASTPP